jgi:hypothetical protein
MTGGAFSIGAAATPTGGSSLISVPRPPISRS